MDPDPTPHPRWSNLSFRPYLSVAVSGINYPFIHQQEICLLVCNRSFTCSASQLNGTILIL
ncbi:mgtA regulatory leader peptide MgtL [Klebsiella pneumoniae]